MKKEKKKLVGGHKSIIIFFSIVSLFIVYPLKASQILDYETEIFINSIIEKIKNVNNIEKKIKFIINSDQNINAFVDQNNLIYINSGLIENSKDHVALLSVIAHEIGHIDKNHIAQRKIKIKKIKNINAISSLSILASSLISNNAEMIKGLALSSASTADKYINFTKDQEREADIYSLNTLEKLNIYSSSIINLLETIEENQNLQGLTKEKMRVSTHPYFEERIDLINYLKSNEHTKFDTNVENKFKFIKAKFLGYNGNIDKINSL